MLTAHLVDTPHGASVRLTAGGHHVAQYRLNHDDGPGPVPAADTVLERAGWRVVGDWTQTAGGISGGQWEATVEQNT